MAKLTPYLLLIGLAAFVCYVLTPTEEDYSGVYIDDNKRNTYSGYHAPNDPRYVANIIPHQVTTTIKIIDENGPMAGLEVRLMIPWADNCLTVETAPGTYTGRILKNGGLRIWSPDLPNEYTYGDWKRKKPIIRAEGDIIVLSISEPAETLSVTKRIDWAY